MPHPVFQPIRRTWPWLQEPLIGFCVLGGLLFGLNHAVRALGGGDTLVIPAAIRQAASEQLGAALHRPPSEHELDARLRAWVNEEALYREGLRLGLAQGDPEIRQRVLARTASVLLENLPRHEPSDAELAQWLASSQARQDALPTLSLSVKRAGELRVFQHVPEAQMAQLYGAGFVQAARTLLPGHWTDIESIQGRVSTRLYIDGARPAPDFEKLKSGLRLEWQRADERRQLDLAVARLVSRYAVKAESAEASR